MKKLLASLVFCVFASAAAADTNTVTSTVTGTNTVSTVGTTTVDKTPPTAAAPSVVVNNSDVCKSAYSAGVQTGVLGVASGVTVTDKNCERLKLARSLYGMGMKVAAVSTLCQDARVFDAMIMAGTPCPYKGKIGDEALIAWQENFDELPDGVKLIKKAKPKPQTENKTPKKVSGNYTNKPANQEDDNLWEERNDR